MRTRWILAPSVPAIAGAAGTLADACSACQEVYREKQWHQS